MNRRNMIKGSALAAGVAGVTGSLSSVASAAPSETAGQPKFKKGAVILFQGDSITDAGRNRKSENRANDVSGLGHGYPLHAAGGLMADHAEKELKIYNRGISGHKVPDLANRWKRDCIDLKPDVLSILIGVNDIWHKMNGKYDGTVETYRTGFTELLKETREALPETTFVICEPFALRCGAVKDSWFPEFDQRRAVAKEVAKNAGALWVPFQEIFDKSIASGVDPKYWAGDGVHPSLAGHALMAKSWREVVGV